MPQQMPNMPQQMPNMPPPAAVSAIQQQVNVEVPNEVGFGLSGSRVWLINVHQYCVPSRSC